MVPFNNVIMRQSRGFLRIMENFGVNVNIISSLWHCAIVNFLDIKSLYSSTCCLSIYTAMPMVRSNLINCPVNYLNNLIYTYSGHHNVMITLITLYTCPLIAGKQSMRGSLAHVNFHSSMKNIWAVLCVKLNTGLSGWLITPKGSNQLLLS